MSDFPPIIEVLSGHYKYWQSSIGYTDIQLSGLPESINVKGDWLARKEEFHITTISVKIIAELIDPTNTDKIVAQIVKDFKDFLVRNKPDKFKLTKQFRFVQNGEEKTVVVLCELLGVPEFFDELRKKYNKPLPTQPFHITLYTLNSRYGIGILSQEVLNEISVPVDIPELANIKLA